MWLNGTAIACGHVLLGDRQLVPGSGGDNFRVFARARSKQDTGKTDLQAIVDYMDEFANTAEGDDPLARRLHPALRGRGASRLALRRRTEQGDTVTFNLSSLAFSTAPDVKDTEVAVRSRWSSLGTFPVDNTIGTAGLTSTAPPR